MTVVTAYPTELTAEVLERLGAPVPASEIKEKVQGGATIRFTSDKFVMKRLDDVVGPGGWQDDYVTVAFAKPIVRHIGKGDRQREVQIVGSMTCHLKVLGVMKTATVDMEFENSMYGGPSTNGQARVFKRAAMKFGIASELWGAEKDVDESDEQPARSSSARAGRPSFPPKSSQSKPAVSTSRQSSDNDVKPISEKQHDLLVEAGVPESILAALTGGRGGTGSQVLTAVWAAQKQHEDYEDEPLPYVAQILRELKLGYLADKLDGESRNGSEYDEDEDED